MSREKRLILLSLLTGIGLMLIKFLAYFLTDSNAIFSDAAESIVNVIASSFAFYSIYLSSRPKDENHPYGHGKVEFFSIFVEGGLIFIAGSIILVKAFYALIFPSPITNIMEGFWLILSTAIVNFGVGEYLKRRGGALRSLTIEADGKHLQIDAISSLGLIAGLYLISITKMAWIDTALSAGLGSYILWSGYKMLRKSISGLMDESDETVMQEVVDVLGKTRKEDWIDVHNMRIQRYGRELHVDCHLTLPRYYTLTKVHNVISDFEDTMNEGLDMPTELFIHADPCMPQCCHYCAVQDCPVRAEPYNKHIEWTSINLPKNMKHFREV